MKEDKAAAKTSAGKENEPVTENTAKKKTKEEKPPTKVVVRRLPPSMTEEQFKMQVSPLPDYDYFYFVPADMSLMPNAFSRAYINFMDQNDLFIFTQKFDGYVFVDSKGGEYSAVVEFAPFQRIPKTRPNRKKDSKVGTIEADPIYIAFKERLEAENLENKTAVNTSKQHFFETSLASDKKEEVSNTPLLDYIRNKRAERQRIRDEKREEKRKKDLERRRAKEEQRRVKKEDETSVVKNPPSSPVNPNPKTKEASVDKKKDNSKIKEISSNKITEKKKETSEKLPPEKTVETAKTIRDEQKSEPTKNNCDKQIFESSVKTSQHEQICKKVREVVNFFSKFPSETSDESNKVADTDVPKCIKHEDLEREIMKSVNDVKEEISKVFATSQVSSSNKLTKLSIPMAKSNLKESNVSSCSYPISASRDPPRPGLKMYMACPPRKVLYARSNSDIVMRPLRVDSRERTEDEPTVRNFVKDCEIVRPVRPIRVSIPVIQGSTRGCEVYNPTARNPFEGRTPVRVNVPLISDMRNEIIADRHVQNEMKLHPSQKDNEEKVSVSKNANTVGKEHKITVLQSMRKEDSISSGKTEKFGVKPASSSETLKKNLQKVIADVLGNTKISSPKENLIDKPKTFVRRGCSGSGDECLGKGFNTPNFYLPPRAFGFGVANLSSSRGNKNANNGIINDKSPRHCTSFTGKSTSVLRKSLPPFSKKSASSSKSDGDIEKSETEIKTGGSEENLKRIPQRIFIDQMSDVMPRKPLTVEKDG